MHALVLSIGDELVSGLTVNTNATWLSAQLSALGIHTLAHVTVADLREPIARAIREAAGQVDLLLISGGLGPTDDDLTRQGLADALGEDLVEDPQALAEIQAWFASRNRPFTPSNGVQALRPRSATCISNTAGTAPGLQAIAGRCRIFVMPGVPREMKEMFTRSVLPALRASSGDRVTLATKLNTFGLGESQLGERIADLMKRGSNPAVGTTVADGVVSVRIYATGPRAEAQAMVEQTRQTLRERLGPLVFGQDADTLEAAVASLLVASKRTIATAESCTGGLLAQLLTNVPGSSAYFLRGWVTYANQAKTEEVGVAPSLLAAHGAVSEPVARAMAEGARRVSGADYGIGITGVAGPSGGSLDKPVGAVWIALSGPSGRGESAEALSTDAWLFIFPGDRAAIRLRAAQSALARLRWRLMGVPIPS